MTSTQVKIMSIKTAYSFDDVLLVPKMSEISSRKDIDLSTDLGNNIILNIPIISSPMDTITETHMAAALSNIGGFGIIHRYNTPQEQANQVICAKQMGATIVGAAIGVSGDFLERAKILKESGVSVLCIDIAHGHHSLMRTALKSLRKLLGWNIHMMAGNVATLEGFNDLSDWGADSVRVGIGGGSICSTRIMTGHGVPTLQSIIDCSYSDRSATIIADGGIRNSGDIVKALAAGADSVMLGSMLSGTHESPGEEIYLNGERYKTYRGMASRDAQIDWRGHFASVEGISSTVPAKGSVKSVILEIERGVRSGLSYSGAATIRDLSAKSSFTVQTSAGALESSAHINK